MALIKPDRYKEIFTQRGESSQAHARWLEVSLGVLEDARTSASGDIERAAKDLAAGAWDAQALSYLAYAGFCFWHLPMAHLIDETSGADPHWAGNRALQKLVEAPETPERQAVLMQVNDRLDLASLAFLARGKVATDYVAFQEELFFNVITKLAHDEGLAKIVATWPRLLDENGRLRPDKKEKGRLAPSVVEEILAHNPQALAEKIAGLIFDEAQKTLSGIYKDLPSVRPFIYVGSKLAHPPSSGCYYYDWEGGKGAGYNLDCEDPFAYASAPRFIGCNLHEPVHILQMHAARKEAGNPQSLFFCEALVYVESLRQCAFDNPRCTYPLRSCAPEARAANNAYAARPTEYYAHLFDATAEHCLCNVLGVQEGRRMYEPDVSSLIKIAVDARVLVQPPSTQEPPRGQQPPTKVL